MTFAFFDNVDGINVITVDTIIDELDDDRSSGDVSLREAIASANASEIPDLIDFSEALKGQTIALSLGELVLNGEILLDGDQDRDGQPDITIDANAASRILNIQGPNVAIDGLALINGFAEGNGGAVYAEAAFDIANSAIRDSTATGDGGGVSIESSAEAQFFQTIVSGNSADNGGGVSIGLGSALLSQGSTFTQNQGLSLGGGLHNLGALDLVESEIDSNQSLISGGGVSNQGQAQLESSRVSNNSGRTSGGGISNDNGGLLTVIDSQIEDNLADLFGAGIHNVQGDLSVVDSSVSGNSVDFEGGGIAGSGAIINSSISQNSSYEYGGGLSGNFTISNSVITQNTAAFGGGILGGGNLENSLVHGNSARLNGAGIQGSDLKITNSTISNNSLEDDFFSGAGLEVQGQVELGNSIISGNTGGDDVSISESGTLVINGVNLVEDGSFKDVSVLNVDPLLGEVTNNGGSLPSQRLMPGSPAIDAGENNLVSSELDQRGNGFDRILDGNGDGVAAVDLGSVESETVEPIGNTNPEPLDNIYLTLKKAMSIQGAEFCTEDIILKNNAGFSKIFDGSDVGLSNNIRVTAFDFIGENQILMSFNHKINLEGAGQVDDSDIVKFTATSLGEATVGSFELYFDGSDVDLSKSGEDIDALTQLSTGEILVSTKGNISAGNIEAKREDILKFTPTSLGEETSGTWSKYLDMSDVGLDQTNVDAVGMRDDGEVLLSTAGQFKHSGMTMANDDVFGFTPSNTGENTAGTFSAPLFDGSQFGLLGNSVGAFDVV